MGGKLRYYDSMGNFVEIIPKYIGRTNVYVNKVQLQT